MKEKKVYSKNTGKRKGHVCCYNEKDAVVKSWEIFLSIAETEETLFWCCDGGEWQVETTNVVDPRGSIQVRVAAEETIVIRLGTTFMLVG
ncbi:hypothetical protein Pcinc_042262 [Petrolisthes cinctipes]|uniref:Uncharacterized protein n=1 Tax=Petrolisthes cinctipes TaxID=88211 RepID=A0AAE1BL00_PETCI|nr:hypothetical protein Pcinc_042262 [Petrolisthes cinctipes]